MNSQVSKIYKNGIREQQGISIVLVAIFIFLFIAIAALAIDISHLYAVRSELQNAADAGALSGARNLYDENGLFDSEAIAIAQSAATDNIALAIGGSKAVDVLTGDVKIGHWSFGIKDGVSKGFTPVSSPPTKQLYLIGVKTEDLDDPNFDLPVTGEKFVNAVQVTARRAENGTPASSFFAIIFGDVYKQFFLSATSTAYIGFAASVQPGEVDQPIAICAEDLVDGCKTGRMTNDNEDTARWTNFGQPCGEVGGVTEHVCAGGNDAPLIFGEALTTSNGMVQTAFDALLADSIYDCWNPYKNAHKSWLLTLPVVDCANDIVPQKCTKLLGVVEVHLLWIQRNKLDVQGGDLGPVEMNITNVDHDPTLEPGDIGYGDEPEFLDTWKCSKCPSGGGLEDRDDWDELTKEEKNDLYYQCFNEFVAYYELLNKVGKYPFVEVSEAGYTYPAQEGEYVTLKDGSELAKSLFFKPDCKFHKPTGSSGGNNFGVLAKIPVLVE